MWSWLFVTDVGSLAGGRLQGFGLAVLVFVFNVGLSVAVAYQAVRLAQATQARYRPWQFVLLNVLIFAATDWLIAWGVALIWIGPQGSLDTLLPLGSLALPLMMTPLRLASRLVGLSGLAGLTAATLWFITQAKHRRLAVWPLTILLGLSMFGGLLYRHHSGSVKTATIISERVNQRLPAVQGSDLVVFPEYGLNDVDNSNLNSRLQAQPGQTSYFIGSQQNFAPNQDGHRNDLIFGDSRRGITSVQKKYRLMPGGEDLSYVGRWLLRLTGQTTTLKFFSQLKSVVKGPRPLQSLAIDDQTVIAPGLCSSIIAPEDYRRATKQGASVLTNSASLTVFGASKIFGWQQQSLARFMATANNRYFLQSANAASAYAVSPSGQLLAEVKGLASQRVNWQNINTRTVYTRFGEWPVWAGAIVIICLCLKRKDDHV